MTKVKTFTVGLPVTDLNSAVEWYRRLLGEVEEVNPAPGVWEFQIISSGWLQLFESEINNPNLAVVRFESDDIEARRMQALSFGTDVGEIETVPEAVRYFEFRDPFGNQLSSDSKRTTARFGLLISLSKSCNQPEEMIWNPRISGPVYDNGQTAAKPKPRSKL
jgi:lactoylglutathione lyase